MARRDVARQRRSERGAASNRWMTWAVAVASVLLGTAGAIAYGETPRRDNRPTEAWSDGSSYIAVHEVFWSAHRVHGHYFAFDGIPDRAVVVAGSDVERLLAGQEPRMVLEELRVGEPWTDLSLTVPRITCSGPNGSCQPGDLPAIVVMKGAAWEGMRRDQLERSAQQELPVSFSLSYAPAYAGPAIAVLGVAGLVALLVALVATVAWLAAGGLRAGDGFGPLPANASAEVGLLVMHLAEAYVAGILRTRAATGAAILVVGVVGQLVLMPYLVDERVERHFPLPWPNLDPVVDLAFWFWLPIVVLVTGGFWARAWRDSRAALGQWRRVRLQLGTARDALLEG